MLNRLQKKTIKKILVLSFAVLLISEIFYDPFNYLIKLATPSHQIELQESFELAWDAPVTSPVVLIDSCISRDRRIFVDLDTNRNDLTIPIGKGLLFSKLYLTNFDLSTGQINWQTRLDTYEPAIGTNDHNIFSVVRDRERCTPTPGTDYCDAVQISSYIPASGEEVWTVYNQNMNSASMLCLDNEVISIDGSATRSNFIEEISLAVDTGEQLTYQGIILGHNSYFQNWNLDQLGFERDSIISYEQNGNILFFLTKEDNTLWAVNSDLSEIVGRVQFDGIPFGAGNYISRFGIGSDGNMVAVYLNDSRQLFVFHFIPPK